ncbi:hypothetical protein GCM10023189_33310 [Nibrella saemangeumensis]|uniref:DUF3592 domain-containing protein n=1 Tax=Nibrella saemangeumensis TaxID=1084526 RepID=A0ABP8N132_9BACT
MNGINILLLCVALLGFLPLAIFIYKKNLAKRILTTGRATRASVYHITTNRKSNTTVVYYFFIASNGRQYKGNLTTRPGEYRINGTVDVFYLPDNPHHNTVKGAWNDNWFLLFVVAIALAIVYMMYKLYLMLNLETL